MVGFIESDWSQLGREQRSRLLEAMVAGYPMFRSFMPQRHISYLIGKYYPPETAIRALSTLATSPRAIAREMVVDGLKDLLRRQDLVEARGDAERLLVHFSRDVAASVREEAVWRMDQIGIVPPDP